MHLDLNLLTALDALLEEGSVAGAADRLNLSAPAVSRTLGRIRRITGDQILVRTGRTMIPTPHALAVQGEVHDLVQRARAALAPERELDLTSLDRVFTLRGHDAVTVAIGPRLLDAVQRQAPLVSMRLLAEPSGDTKDLRHGEVDLEIGSTEPELPEVRMELLGEDHLVVAMRPNNPLNRGRMTAQRFAKADHVIVSRRGRLSDPIDDRLTELEVPRRVVASAPTSTAALYFVTHSNLVVAVPQHMCRDTIELLGLRTKPLPLNVPAVPLYLAWHQRYDNDKAHAWMRGVVRDAFAGLYRP